MVKEASLLRSFTDLIKRKSQMKRERNLRLNKVVLGLGKFLSDTL